MSNKPIVRVVKLSEIKPNPDNPRLIKDDSFNKLVESIKEFPEMIEAREIVVNAEMVILGGNMRYKALQKAGVKEVPVKIVNWPEEKQREFVVKDNVSGGEWDYDMLANQYELEELDAWGVDIPGIKELGAEIEEDAPPELSSDPPISKLGEVYQLGKHRLLCGDSTLEDDVAVLLGGLAVDIIVTDPPYNVDYVGKTKEKLTIKNDKKDDEEFRAFLSDYLRAVDPSLKAGASFYIWHADLEGYNFRGAVKDVGWLLKQTLIWNKNSMVMGRQDYHWKHEPCLYGWKSGGSHSWYADRKQVTVIDMDRPTKSKEHPTMKPVGLMAYCIQNSSKAGDIVYDGFLGSGSTLIACEQTDRTCYGIELDPKYADVIRKRYWKFINNGEEDGWETGTPVIQ